MKVPDHNRRRLISLRFHHSSCLVWRESFGDASNRFVIHMLIVWNSFEWEEVFYCGDVKH